MAVSDFKYDSLIRFMLDMMRIGDARIGTLGNRVVVTRDACVIKRPSGLYLRFFDDFRKVYHFPAKSQIGGALVAAFESRFA